MPDESAGMTGALAKLKISIMDDSENTLEEVCDMVRECGVKIVVF